MKFIFAQLLFGLFSCSLLAVIEMRPQHDGVLLVDTQLQISAKFFNDGTYVAYRYYLSPTGTSLVQQYDEIASEAFFKAFESQCLDPMDVDPKPSEMEQSPLSRR